MLILRQLSFLMAGRPLFEEADATVPAGARVGVVGRNGAGKSTLFRLIRGELTADGGEIELPKAWRVGGVAQEAPARSDSLVEIVLEYDQERAALLAEAETATDPERIAELQTRLADIGAHSAEAAGRFDSKRLRVRCGGAGAAFLVVLRRLADARGAGRRALLGAGFCCCLMSRPTISISKEPCGWRAFSPGIRARCC